MQNFLNLQSIDQYLNRLFFFIIILLSCALFNTSASQSYVWLGPFYSAAANHKFGQALHVDTREVREFGDMDVAERAAYRFKKSDTTEPYLANDVGFVYLIIIAKTLFFWLSDQMAIEALQMFVHGIISVIILFLLPGPSARLTFFLLYAINPVIIYYVTFPYYYFWQALPSFAVIYFLQMRRHLRTLDNVSFLLISLILGIIIVARPPVILLVLFFYLSSLVIFNQKKLIILGISLTFCIAYLLFAPNERNPWHTVYVGIGGYTNPYGLEMLSDNYGYKLFKDKTGTKLNPSVGGNYYDSKVIRKYSEVTKDVTLEYIKNDPWIFVRNALLNIFQSYSVGYVNEAPRWVHYTAAFIGFIAVLCLLYSRQFIPFLAVGLASGGFTLYYPPIQAYMYGAFILLVVGAIQFFHHIGFCAWFDRRIPNCLSRIFMVSGDQIALERQRVGPETPRSKKPI